MKKRWTLPTLAGLAALAACADTPSGEGLVARVDGYELSVDEVANLLVDQENLPNDAQVVHALADLWIDYTLLAAEMSSDSTLASLDLEPLVRTQLEQEMIFQLRDSVIQVDTVITDTELRSRWDAEAPEAQLQARHILMTYPLQSSQPQRDSVRALLQSVRQRALAGEDFAALARAHSQDPGNASIGGDLGTFGRGDLAKPLEDAAFALEPGEVSEVVETPFGLHVVRLEGKEAPGFDQFRDQFRMQLLQEKFVQAESLYVAGVESRANPQVTEGALEVLKELARDPGSELSGRAARRDLVTFSGGSYTVGDFRQFVQSSPPQLREQVQTAPDEQVETFLKGLAQRELLVAEAASAGLSPAQTRVDSLVSEAREQLRAIASEIGLRSLDRAPDEAIEPAVTRAVSAALRNILSGAADVVPLGEIAFQLRSGANATIYDEGAGQVLIRVGEVRAGRGLAPSEEIPVPTPPSDSTAAPGE